MSKESPTQEEQLFLQLVSSISTGVWMAMGKLANPMTGKIERNMAQASYQLDTLDMLLTRTAGNLGDWENDYLSHLITDLKMNYLDESKKPDPKPEEEDSSSQDEPEQSDENDPEPNSDTEDK